MEKVYLESSFISYLVTRPSTNLIIAAHQRLTLDWWERRRADFWCCISEPVMAEIAQGDPIEARKRLEIAASLPILPSTDEAEQLAQVILQRGFLPPTAATDAAHLALASFEDVDYLLTWNCKHLANAQILKRIKGLMIELGNTLPAGCTPEELLGEDYDAR